MDPKSKKLDQVDDLTVKLSALADSVAKLTENAIVTDQRIREMSAETDRRFRETDERIGKLVSTIGQFIKKR